MNARSVRIYNLIPFLSGRADGLKLVEGKPRKVLEAVRESCVQKDHNLAAWAETVERRCPVPLGHPYRRYAERLPAGDPLRTLGCWAFGAGNSWVTIEEIAWEDGSASRPQEEHREWLKKKSAALLASVRRERGSGKLT